jgi:hypothetical protein
MGVPTSNKISVLIPASISVRLMGGQSSATLIRKVSYSTV